MSTIKLFKKFADGGVRSVDCNDNEESVTALLSSGYFLTEAEAESGKVAETPTSTPAPTEKKAAPKPAAAKKPAAKKTVRKTVTKAAAK